MAIAQVEALMTQAGSYANSATAGMQTFIAAMNSAAQFTPPPISVSFSGVGTPAVPAMPTAPTVATITDSDLAAPADYNATINSFTPTALPPDKPNWTFPDAPSVVYGDVPPIADPQTITVADAPTVTLPTVPTMLALTTPTISDISTHPEILSGITDMPTLTLLAPTAYSYTVPTATDAYLEGTKSFLADRLAKGGTGLVPAVEDAIWARGRARETQIALANIAEVTRSAEALGFQLPTGTVAAQMRQAQQDYYDKLSTLSRDTTIKQAEMEQANVKDTITNYMQLTSVAVDRAYKMEQLTFETAKAVADNSIQSYNAQVEKFKALLGAKQTLATAYQAVISGEMAKVDVYKAKIAGEQAKAEVNKALVDQYRAQVEGSMAVVQIYKTQVDAAQARIAMEQAKLSAAETRIRGFVAQVNAETAKVETYKARISAETLKTDTYRAAAETYSVIANTELKNYEAQISKVDAEAKVKSVAWDGFRAKAEAQKVKYERIATNNSALIDGYRVAASAAEAQATVNARIWEGSMRQYEAGQQIALSQQKMNADVLADAAKLRADLAKTGAQVYAQLASGAYAMVHGSAGVSGGYQNSVSYSYSNDTQDAAPTITTFID